jgi:TRAP-type uncharacterized transport system substrate-binding protein
MQLSSRGRAALLPWRSAALAALLFSLVAWPAAPAAFAQTAKATQRSSLSSQQAQQKKYNDDTLMVLGGYPGTSYFAIAHDIAAALGGGDGLRMLALDAPGGTDSLQDLLLLRGVDLALVPANALVSANATGAFGPGLPERVGYITELYGEEVHILAGPGIGSFEDLRGKKIAVPPADGNAEFTIRDFSRRLHLEAEVVKMAPADAVDEIHSGTIAALVLMGGKPLRFLAGLPKDGSLHLVALPSTPALEDAYAPAGLRADDYPTLIPPGQTIDTVAVSAVLVANNAAKWEDSSRRIARFVPAFFAALSELAGPQRHPKWGEVNLAATLTGWSRTAAAKDWLEQTKQEQTASVQKVFEDFLRASSPPGSPPPSPKERSQLFDEFVKWTRNAAGAASQGARP